MIQKKCVCSFNIRLLIAPYVANKNVDGYTSNYVLKYFCEKRLVLSYSHTMENDCTYVIWIGCDVNVCVCRADAATIRFLVCVMCFHIEWKIRFSVDTMPDVVRFLFGKCDAL